MNFSAGFEPIPSYESVWMRRGTWGSIVIGAVVGFALTVILATAASGWIAGSAASNKEAVGPQAPATIKEDRSAARSAAIGGGAFLILTALAAGLAGGIAAGRISQVHRPDVAMLGVATWAVGLVILVTLVSFGASGPLGGFGAEAGATLIGFDAEAERTALVAATYGVWGFFLAQLLGLGATILGAKIGMKRRLRLHPAGAPTR